MKKFLRFTLNLGASLGASLCVAAVAVAEHSPQHQRHELMEAVGDAAKPLGGMLRGKMSFDADVVMKSLMTWQVSAEAFGDLFPEGSESGEGTEAAPEIWTDRAGFDAALAKFLEDTNTAIAAKPQTLEAAQPLIGAAFKNCKGCHDKYRIEDE